MVLVLLLQETENVRRLKHNWWCHATETAAAKMKETWRKSILTYDSDQKRAPRVDHPAMQFIPPRPLPPGCFSSKCLCTAAIRHFQFAALTDPPPRPIGWVSCLKYFRAEEDHRRACSQGESVLWLCAAIIAPRRHTLCKCTFVQSALKPQRNVKMSIRRFTGALCARGFFSPPGQLFPFCTVTSLRHLDAAPWFVFIVPTSVSQHDGSSDNQLVAESKTVTFLFNQIKKKKNGMH